MKALSVRQPWAWLIIQGIKTVENRSWATSYRGEILIHAAQATGLNKRDLAGLRDLVAEYGVIMPDKFLSGGIIGRANLIDCVLSCDDEYDAEWHDPGYYAFVLRDACEMPFVALPGKQHLFEVAWSKIHPSP